jgi:NifU-like protein involved in Fe-S cluster formation
MDDVVYKSLMIDRIGIYKKHFVKYLSDIETDNLEGKSIEELENILTNVKEIVSNRNFESTIRQMISVIGFFLNGKK